MNRTERDRVVSPKKATASTLNALQLTLWPHYVEVIPEQCVSALQLLHGG